MDWLALHFPRGEQVPLYCVMREAARHGHLEMLERIQMEDFPSTSWLCRKEKLTDLFGEPISWTLAEEHLYKDCLRALSTDAMDCAAAGGHLDVVIWLDAVRPEACTKEAMNGAASNGHLEVVSWLHRFRSEGCSTAAMDMAAANGHMEVVRWLHANRSEGCTVKAMDGAASNGHLEMVQWLHANRGEGCTTAAMDSAAKHGHLNVMKFLHSNRSEGCTSNAIENAVHGCRMRCCERIHLHVADWLHNHYPQKRLGKEGFRYGYKNFAGLLLFLFVQYPDMFTEDFLQTCLGYDNHDDEYMYTSPPHVGAWLEELLDNIGGKC